VISISPVIMLIVVVFPAPLCPNKAKIYPSYIVILKFLTACFPDGYILDRFFIIKALFSSSNFLREPSTSSTLFRFKLIFYYSVSRSSLCNYSLLIFLFLNIQVMKKRGCFLAPNSFGNT
jgi:hypothetical protein